MIHRPLSLAKKGYWENFGNHRKFFEQLGKSLSIRRWQDWYQVNSVDVLRNGGAQLLKTQYSGNVISALTTVYPEYPWQYFRFVRFSKEEFDPKVHRLIFNQLGEHLGVKTLSDWYQVKQTNTSEFGIQRLLQDHYRGFLPTALMNVYPEFRWKIWQFVQLPLNFWKDKENQKAYFDQLQREWNIKYWEEWYEIRIADVKGLGGGGLLVRHHRDSLLKALSFVYPEFPWDESRATKGKRNVTFKAQRHLFNQLKVMFPSEELFMDFILATKEGNYELDIAIPSLKIAFEYQGVQHYTQSSTMFDPVAPRIARDKVKERLCEEAGITLVQIPFWWDSNIKSLQATIYSKRPDLVSNPGDGVLPIPSASGTE
eukprot:TRINITY_DN23180_c0_g1_i1.p1 TRINITY_DN23180_c0_g1~~TRINITY_DN23180_c0_g1_i1.p1  ORF type:complete len:370 (+),score=65.36 TRINITY_DN23180_c0_g1_i1:1430-2539(+)